MKSPSPSESGSPGPSFPEDDRFHWLAQRGAEGGLDRSEAAELAARLADSEAAREIYVGYCQLHAALDQEAALHEALAAALRPGNVVSLPGSRTVVTPSDESVDVGGADASLGRKVRFRRRLVATAFGAAAVFTAALLLLPAPGERDSGGGETVGAEPTTPASKGTRNATTEPGEIAAGKTGKNERDSLKDRGEESQSPEEQYQSSPVLAQVSGGSQSRPPTTLVTAGAKTRISFNRDIRPILSDNCFHCHGPDESGREADLRLDLRQTAIASESNDGAPIVPGNLDESEFFARISTTDPDDQMPPPDSHKRLTPAQIAMFRQWILEGAEWEEHWAFIAPKQETPPREASGWARNDIDHFVAARLAEEGLDPSEEADKLTLIRRATLDLTGLPPTPEEIDAFVADESPEAYPRLLDRLLDSRAYGEHRARYWLDAARYGDTHGLHLDNYREIWPYRDWVIGAYNENLPFDQFTIQQLAGDLMPAPSQDQLVATGFNRCNVTTSEGGAIAEEFLVRYAVDRASTTATVWMGLTAGCAQCHNHKYDPISQREFYQLFAYFNNTTQPGMDGNAKDSPPVIRVFSGEADKERFEALKSELAKLERETVKPAEQAAEAEAGFQAWLASEDRAARLGGFRLPGSLLEGTPEVAGPEPLDAGNVGRFQRSEPFTIAFRYRAPDEDGRTVLMRKTDPDQRDRGWRVVLEDQAINLELIESWPGRTLRSGVTRLVRTGSSGHFVFTYDGSGTSEGIGLYLNGKEQASRFVKEWFDTMDGDFLSEAPLLIGGSSGAADLTPTVSDVRLFDRRLSGAEIKLLTDRDRLRGLAAKPAEKRDGKETAELRAAWLLAFDEAYREATLKRGEIETAISAIESRMPVTLVMQEKAETPATAHVLDRGEYDKALDEVGAGVPDFLPPLPEGAPANRLGLARGLVSGQHPLTARVMVNRMWQELFGVGLVRTAEDFGTQGEPPSHPRLLDWLAIHFVESGWDMKALYREIMLSATYRQSARVTPELRQRDPENRLLARGPRFRLDAEVLRDQALFVSGLLVSEIGGKGVNPYQPPNIWEPVGFGNSNTRNYKQGTGQDLYRRSLYTFIKRTAPPPFLSSFDAPNREQSCTARGRSNTPLQALQLMNDVQHVEAARNFAQRILKEGGATADQRIKWAWRVVTSRWPEADELQVAGNALAQHLNRYQSDEAAAKELISYGESPADETVNPAELAAYTLVANLILNLDETVSKN